MPNITSKKILKDFQTAREYRKPWLKEAKEDFEYLLGKQWKQEDVEKLARGGVDALTINKIQPYIFLTSGIQRQNRSDYLAFPEGEEDSLVANISTILLKHLMKTTLGEYKSSEQFEDGITCGEGYIEPFIDYTYDLVTGDMKLSKDSPFEIYPSPNFKEYDMSDCHYIIKFKPDLLLEDLLVMFPEQDKKIREIADTKVNIDALTGEGTKVEGKRPQDYYTINEDGEEVQAIHPKDNTFDMMEYYYKKPIKKYLLIDKKTGNIKEFEIRQQAEKEMLALLANDAQLEADTTFHRTPNGDIVEGEERPGAVPGSQFSTNPNTEPSAVIIERNVPEIWVATMIGGSTIISDERSWTYPNWKGYPFIPFFAHRTTTIVKDRDKMVQGIVRGLKDPQREHNKRRTQELRILNTSASSGWLAEENSFKDKGAVKKFGSSPGVLLEYKKGRPKPEKITPSLFPSGHAALAQENVSDMREISGINTDLLAQNDSQASGRAILLRQQQGMVMIQRILDNFEHTRKLLGRFLLSQLSEVFTVERAVKVLGESFIQENFQEPVLDEQGQPQIDPNTGELLTAVNEGKVGQVINQILNDASVGKYDVAVGQGLHSETVRYSNYLLLLELIQTGAPIPPEVIVDESLLSEGSKVKIREAINQAREAAPQQ